MKKVMAGLFLGTMVLTGCVDANAQINATTGNSVLQLKPQFIAGGLVTQATVDNYTKLDINHLIVKLYKLNGSTETPALDTNSEQVMKDVPKANLDDTITIQKLNANTTYRIRAYAYKNTGTSTDDLISTADVYSSTDVTLTNNDTPTMANLRVKLLDKDFSGTATSSGIVVTDGGLSTTGPVEIQ